MQGKEKAIDDFDDLLRGNNQGQAENNQGALRSSFYSGANQRGALGDLQPGNNNHQGFGGAPNDLDDFFIRPIDAGVGGNQDFGFEPNANYQINDLFAVPELPGGEEDLRLGTNMSENFWKTKQHENPHLVSNLQDREENNQSIFNDPVENQEPQNKPKVEQDKPVEAETSQKKVEESPKEKEAEKKQLSNEKSKSYKSAPRNEKWEMEIKSDHFNDDGEKQTFLRKNTDFQNSMQVPAQKQNSISIEPHSAAQPPQGRFSDPRAQEKPFIPNYFDNMGPVNQPRPAALSDISDGAGAEQKNPQLNDRRENKYQQKVEQKQIDTRSMDISNLTPTNQNRNQTSNLNNNNQIQIDQLINQPINNTHNINQTSATKNSTAPQDMRNNTNYNREQASKQQSQPQNQHYTQDYDFTNQTHHRMEPNKNQRTFHSDNKFVETQQKQSDQRKYESNQNINREMEIREKQNREREIRERAEREGRQNAERERARVAEMQHKERQQAQQHQQQQQPNDQNQFKLMSSQQQPSAREAATGQNQRPPQREEVAQTSKIPSPHYQNIDYQRIDPEKLIGDWIPTKQREQFIKDFRLKKNLEIKFKKGYDLYKHRVEEWKDATPEMKHSYEEMKKEAQVQEYKFMENVMIKCNYKNVENSLRVQYEQIKTNPNHKTNEGNSFEKVQEFQMTFKNKLVQNYIDQQRKVFRTFDMKLYQMQEKNRLIQYFVGISQKDFCDRYIKRYNALITHQEQLVKYKNDYEKEKRQLELQRRENNQRHQDDTIRSELDKIGEDIDAKQQKVDQIEKLLCILKESKGDITYKIFNKQNLRNEYCENLYELEKCLKKFYEMEVQAQTMPTPTTPTHQVGQKRPQLSMMPQTSEGPMLDPNAGLKRQKTDDQKIELDLQHQEQLKKTTLREIAQTPYEDFEKRLAIMLNQIPQDQYYNLEEVKQMDQDQKENKKESFEIVKKNFQNAQNQNFGPAQKSQAIPSQKGDVLVNYNLEALITMNHQDKQKRDRIGIMFKMAKESGWDGNKTENKPEQIDDKFNQKGNYQKLHLKGNEILEETFPQEGINKSAVETQIPQGMTDLNVFFESGIEADERNQIKYTDIFQDLPVFEQEEGQEMILPQAALPSAPVPTGEVKIQTREPELGGIQNQNQPFNPHPPVPQYGQDPVQSGQPEDQRVPMPQNNTTAAGYLFNKGQQSVPQSATGGQSGVPPSSTANQTAVPPGQQQPLSQVQQPQFKQFRDLINDNIKQLRNRGFEVIDCRRVSQNVSQLNILKADSEYMKRECLFWIDISTQKCYIKKIKSVCHLSGRVLGKENFQISIDTVSNKVRTSTDQTRPIFDRYGVFEINDLGDFFKDSGYIDQMVKQS